MRPAFTSSPHVNQEFAASYNKLVFEVGQTPQDGTAYILSIPALPQEKLCTLSLIRYKLKGSVHIFRLHCEVAHWVLAAEGIGIGVTQRRRHDFDANLSSLSIIRAAVLVKRLSEQRS